MNISANDEVLTKKGQRKKSGKGGWIMRIIEIQEDITGGFIARGKRILKSGKTGCDFEVTSEYIELDEL
jgi:hypothetical protein